MAYVGIQAIKTLLMSLNIVFLDAHALNPGDLSWSAIEAFGTLTVYDRSTADEVIDRAGEADVIILNKTPLQREHFARLKHLRLVCVAASGYDVVDVAAAREYGIPVCNCAGYGTRAVAQMVVAHLLEVTNRVGHYAAATREGLWTRCPDFCCWDEPLAELAGKTLTVVGYGRIGRAVVDMLRPMGMVLRVVTRQDPATLPADVTAVSLAEAFATSDVISLNCPLTPDNAEFVNAALLATARRGLVLVNTARGRLVDEAAVADALKSGRLGAYCADVLATEPPTADNPLLSAPRAYITPHIAWATVDARQRIVNIIAHNIDAWRNGTPDNVVNKN